MKKAILTLILSVTAQAAMAQSPQLYAADGQYLGNMSANPYDANSISNPYGQYGSPYSSTSINNPYSTYGSPYSNLSPNNPYSSSSGYIMPQDYSRSSW